MNRSSLVSFLWTALGTVALAQAIATNLGPPDPFTQLYLVLPGTGLALLVALWLTRGGWDRLGARPTENSAWWFWGSWILAVLVLNLAAESLLVATGPSADLLVDAFSYLVATVVAAWLAYRGGAATIRRAVAR